MERTLFVVVGAGASYDAAATDRVEGDAKLNQRWDGNGPAFSVPRSALRPPLVTGLFDQRFAKVLNRYPLAQMAAAEIRRHTGASDADPLEKFLREQYRDSEHEHDKRIFHAIHFYLQDLLWTVSRNYTEHADNYDLLVLATARIPRVVFISLNYDTLLDDRLRHLTPGSLQDLDSYTDRGRKWSLIKPHGSVDWCLRISPSSEWTSRGHQFVDNPPADIAINRKQFSLRRANSLADVRSEMVPGATVWYYPALSAPLGARDDFTCPEEHTDTLRDELARQDRLDVLMLGYSGLDNEVIKLFAQSGRPLGRVNAVGKDLKDAKSAMGRLVDGVGGGSWNPDNVTASPETFSEFVRGNGLGRYLHSRT